MFDLFMRTAGRQNDDDGGGEATSHSVLLCPAESREHGRSVKLTHIYVQFCPSLLAAALLSVLVVTSRGGRETGLGRRRVGGPVGGTRSRTQEVGRDKEAGNNVMRRGAEPEGGGVVGGG